MPSSPSFPPAHTLATLDAVAAELVLLRQVEEQRSKLAEVRAQLLDAIKAALGGAEVGTLAGVPVVSHKAVLSITLDQTALKRRYPEVAEDCLTITETRRFKLLKATS